MCSRKSSKRAALPKGLSLHYSPLSASYMYGLRHHPQAHTSQHYDPCLLSCSCFTVHICSLGAASTDQAACRLVNTNPFAANPLEPVQIVFCSSSCSCTSSRCVVWLKCAFNVHWHSRPMPPESPQGCLHRPQRLPEASDSRQRENAWPRCA